MKRMVLFSLVALVAMQVSGQKSSVDDFFTTWSGKEGITSVIISGDLFGLLDDLDDDAGIEGLEDKITSVRVIASEDGSEYLSGDFISDIRRSVRRGGYEELMTVRSSDSDVDFLVRTSGNTVRELLVIASGDNAAVVQVKGNMTRSDVERMTDDHGERLSLLEQLEKSGK